MINESQKWPSDKESYDRNYLRIFGQECEHCFGSGETSEYGAENNLYYIKCPYCDGLGYIEKEKR